MRAAIVVIALATAACAPATSLDTSLPRVSDKPTFAWSEPMNGRSVLFVGAHPDDEWGVAPLLADACVDHGASCHFVVASEAKSFGCLPTMGLRDPIECSRIRRDEMRASASLFGGQVEFFGWEDLFYSYNDAGLERTLADWAKAGGGHAALVDRFERVLRRRRPDVVFTMDPRHGSTCHSSHRAVAMLLLEAVDRLPAAQRPVVWLEQTDNIDERSEAIASVNARLGYARWPDTASETVYYDANKRLGTGRSAYDYALAVRRAHRSQYPDEASGKVKTAAAASERWVPLASASSFRPADYCTSLSLERPTFDIPGNKERFGIE